MKLLVAWVVRRKEVQYVLLFECIETCMLLDVGILCIEKKLSEEEST